MSKGKRRHLGIAQDLSKQVVNMLSPSSEKIMVVGSVRRCTPMVGDIEIVALADQRQVSDLFGKTVNVERTDIDDALDQFHEIEHQGWRPDHRHQGKVVKRLIHIHTGMTCDVYVVLDRRAWGAHVVIRTGPRVFSKMVVTKALGFGWHFANGFLLHEHMKRRSPCAQGVKCNRIITLENEADVFETLKITYLNPQERENEHGVGI